MKSGIRIWGQFGTYLGALLSSRLNYSGSNPTQTNENVLNSTNKVNMGLLVGTGIQYPVADRTDLYLGLGFENGFTDITTDSKWGNDGKVNLNRWAFRLGMFF